VKVPRVSLLRGHDPVNNAATAKGALGIERGEGGMSGQPSLNPAVAQTAPVVLGVAEASAVDGLEWAWA
jgi:hypothetical protein